MSDAEGSRPAIDPGELHSVARELKEATANMRAIRSNSSVVIHAGGIANAVAVCVSLSTVMMFMLFAVWMMWQIGEIRGQQEAWIQVWQQQMNRQHDKAP